MQSSPFTLGCSPGQVARMPVTNANTNTARIMQGSSASQSGLSQSSGRKSQFLAILEEAGADDTAVVVDVTAANAPGLSLKGQIREAEKKLRSIMETLNSNLYYSFYLRKAHLSLDKLNEVVETQKALVRQHSGLVAADHLVVLKAVCKRAEGFLVHFQQYEAKYKRDKSRISDDQMQFVDWVHKEHSSPCESSSYDLVTKVISENRGMGIPTVVGRNGERQFPYISSDDRMAMKSLILQSIMRIDNGILVEDITGRRLSQTQRQKAKASLEQSAYESTKLEGSEAYRSHVKRILEDKEAEAKDDRATFYQWLASLGVHEQDSLVGKPVQVLNGRFAGNRGTVVMEYEDGKLHVYWNSEIHEDIHSSDIERISAEQTSQFTLPPITPGSKPPAATSIEDAQTVDENPSTAGPLNDGPAIGYLDSHMSGTEIGPVSSGNQNTGSGTLNDVPTSFALPQAQNDSDPAPENEDMKDVEIPAPAVNLSSQTPFLAFTTTNVPLINTSSLTVGPTAGLGPQPLLPISAPSQHGPAPLPAQDTFGLIDDTEMGGYSNGEDDTAVVSPEDTASSREIEMSVSDGEEPDNMETDDPEEVPEEVGSMEIDDPEEIPEEVCSIEIDNSESHTIPKLPQNVLPGYNCLTSQKPQARDTEGNAHLEYPQTPVAGSNAIDVVAKPTAAVPPQGAVTVEDKYGIEMAILEQAVSVLQGFRSTQNDSESNTDDEQNSAHDDEANVNTQSFSPLKPDASPSDANNRSSDGIPSTTDGHVPTDMGVFHDRTIHKEPVAPTKFAAQQAGAGSTTANTSQRASSANFESSEVASPRKVPTNQDRQRIQGGNSQSKELDEPQALAAKDGKDGFPPPAANRGTIMPLLQEGRRTINAATSRNPQRASRSSTDRKKTTPSSMFLDREPLPGGGYRLVFQAGAREPSYVEHHPQKTRKYGNDVSSADFSAKYHAVRALMAIGQQGSSTSISGPFTTSSISLIKNPFTALHVPISSHQKEQTQAVKEDVDVRVPIYKPVVIGTFLSNAGSANVGQQAITRESTDSSRSYTAQSVDVGPLDEVISVPGILEQTPAPVATDSPQNEGVLEDEQAPTNVSDEVLVSPGIIRNQNINTEAQRFALRNPLAELKAKNGVKTQTQPTNLSPPVVVDSTTEHVNLPNHLHGNTPWYQLVWSLLIILLLGLYYHVFSPTGRACLKYTPGVLNALCNAVGLAAQGIAAACSCIKPVQPAEHEQHEGNRSPQTANNDAGSLATLTNVAPSSSGPPSNMQHVRGASLPAPEDSHGDPSAARLPPYMQPCPSPLVYRRGSSGHSYSSAPRHKRYTHQSTVPFAPHTAFREDRYLLTTLNACGQPQTYYVYGERARNLAKLDASIPFRDPELWGDKKKPLLYNFS